MVPVPAPRAPGADAPAPALAADPAGRPPAGSVEEDSLWRDLNAARPVDERLVRLACGILACGYAVVAWLRHDPDHAWLEVALRGLVCAYGLVGLATAPRFDWAALRGYTLGLAVVLPLVTTILNGLRGHPESSLAFLGLATFAPFVFLQTATDFAVAIVAVTALDAAAIVLLPPTGVATLTVGIVIGVAMITGVVAGFTLLVYRVRLDQSLRWWRDACTRERAMREFGELTAATLGGEQPLDGFAERLRAAYAPDAGCVIVLADEDGGFRVASTAGVHGDAPVRLATGVLPPHLAALLWTVVDGRQPLLHETMPAGLRAALESGPERLGPTASSAALPVVVEGVVAGVVWLFSRRQAPPAAEAVLALQAMAAQLGVALANARLLDRLRRALRVKSEFLNTMSHELRSPLHVIAGYAEMVSAEAGSEEVDRWCTRIGASARELLQLVENTMNVARLDAGKVTLHEEVFFAEDVMAELRESVRALPEAKRGTPVRWTIDPGLPPLRLDRLKLKEIVQNLVSNALKFTREGEVTVLVDRDGPDLRVAVRDTGPGITPEAQTRIFDMFERVEDPQTRDRPAGVGLGLHIVRSLVQLMGGRVDVASEPGKGACFTVRLPLARPVAAV